MLDRQRLCEIHVERHSSVALAREMSDSGESLYMSKSFSHRRHGAGQFLRNVVSAKAARAGDAMNLTTTQPACVRRRTLVGRCRLSAAPKKVLE
jgi:hypothetical protein